MRDEHIIERQGKKFVLYAGLLAEAHERGLVSIETEELDIVYGEDELPLYARHRAVVTVQDRDEIRTYTGHGDADRRNVGKNIVPHLLRMSETRAKARALRDAINVGMAALEELGGDDEPATVPQAKMGAVYPLNDDDAPATGAQILRIRKQIQDLKSSIPKFEQKHGPLDELTYGAAAQFIAEAEDYLERKAK